MITRKTLQRAADIYRDMFANEFALSSDTWHELLTCETFADFEDMQDDLSAGEYDAIEAAIMEQVK